MHLQTEQMAKLAIKLENVRLWTNVDNWFDGSQNSDTNKDGGSFHLHYLHLGKNRSVSTQQSRYNVLSNASVPTADWIPVIQLRSQPL
jgi:hypothetical protein